MKVAMVAQCELRETLGGAKVILETASALREAGVEVATFSGAPFAKIVDISTRQKEFKYFCSTELSAYDVIDYDYTFGPLLQVEFPDKLLVARSVLLHIHEIAFPAPPKRFLRDGLRSVMIHLGLKPDNRVDVKSLRQAVPKTELMTVANRKDVSLLESVGLAREQIIYQPYGVSGARRHALRAARTRTAQTSQLFAFVGSFDYRKGCTDLPRIFRRIRETFPDAQFVLLGAKGLFTNEMAIRKCFDKETRTRLQIHETYNVNDLPDLLANVSVGIFPSYLEGFGFGVLEMIAAGIPVYAYDSPGPSDILPKEWLSNPGDWEDLARRAIECDTRLGEQRALDQAALFDWSDIGISLAAEYRQRLFRLTLPSCGAMS